MLFCDNVNGSCLYREIKNVFLFLGFIFCVIGKIVVVNGKELLFCIFL